MRVINWSLSFVDLPPFTWGDRWLDFSGTFEVFQKLPLNNTMERLSGKRTQIHGSIHPCLSICLSFGPSFCPPIQPFLPLCSRIYIKRQSPSILICIPPCPQSFYLYQMFNVFHCLSPFLCSSLCATIPPSMLPPLWRSRRPPLFRHSHVQKPAFSHRNNTMKQTAGWRLFWAIWAAAMNIQYSLLAKLARGHDTKIDPWSKWNILYWSIQRLFTLLNGLLEAQYRWVSCKQCTYFIQSTFYYKCQLGNIVIGLHSKEAVTSREFLWVSNQSTMHRTLTPACIHITVAQLISTINVLNQPVQMICLPKQAPSAQNTGGLVRIQLLEPRNTWRQCLMTLRILLLCCCLN